MYTPEYKNYLQSELASIKEAGLFKEERIIMGKQNPVIKIKTGQEVLNFCANNYLGLSGHPDLIKACHEGLESWGYGMSSVRFICGTQDIHKILERKIADFLGLDDAILYSSCFDANGGLFEALFPNQEELAKEYAIISEQLNHASIIDGVRLSRAERLRFAHNDMGELEKILIQTQNKKARVIATDGVFSMDGDVAKLDEICDLADKYGSLVMIDDSHSTGFMGKTGRGTHEHRGVMGRVDIITSTLGKAMGGASGGFTAGRQEIIDILRQRSRPYLFSNTMPPPIVASAITVVDLISRTTERRDKLEWNTMYFREKMTEAGFDIKPGVHPIVPIMLYDAKLSQDFARDLLNEGIYVIGFFFPVVPRDQARIRVQLSAGHEKEHLDRALEAFVKIGKKHNVLKKK